ncbi:AMP-dependent synthetase ligase domain containing protein [Aphelenchoides besseyi]|nr:AMP-dependent synthetase ligase domain containing protein [Aphelenchoides besseyi]
MSKTAVDTHDHQNEQNFVRSSNRKSIFFNKKSQQPPSNKQYSRLLVGSERIRESIMVDEPVTVPTDSNVRTIYEALLRGSELSKNGDFVGERCNELNGKYGWLKYKTVIEQAQFIGSALLKLGAEPGQETRVALAGYHSPSSVVAMFGLVSYSMVAVPLYYNYAFKDSKEIVNKCNIEFVFCDDYERANQFIQSAHEIPTLKHIILLKRDNRAPNGPLKENSKLNLFDWSHILKLGKDNLRQIQPPIPTDVFVIVHTSGTTGSPKGAMISHQSLLITAFSAMIQWFMPPNKMRLTSADTYFSFLSPAHCYELIMQVLTAYNGARIGIYSKNIANLLDDMRELSPTFVAFVPRVLVKFKSQIESNIRTKNPVVRKLFDIAIKSKTRDLNNGILNYNTLWDRTIFKPIHRMVGDKLRFIITGGATIMPETMYFSRIVFGCPVFEGYGQTESAAAACITLANDTKTGHIGVPSPWCQIKLISVPELGYRTERDEGEICLRGRGIMNGYFKNEELTKNVIDNFGWLRTGDIGAWNPNGTLKIVDRIKHFFKLSQGDYVAPESIESIYSTHPLVTQIFVDGRSTESHLIAIVVPNVNELRNLILDNDELNHLPMNELLEGAEFRRLVLNELRGYGKQNGLTSLEQIRNLHFESEEFTVENGFLTPTLKMKRKQVADRYKRVIDSLYSENLI